MNQDVKEIFIKRTKMIEAIREIMQKKGFLEMELPTLQIQYGGAEARPFVTHINAWNMDMYLSISPELYLKRLIVGGFEKVYTICKNFRNEGSDKTHNPEFTMLEAYWAYKDYNDMMDLLEEVYEHACMKINGTTKVKHNYMGKEVEIDFKRPWQRMTVKEAIKKYADMNVDNMDDDEIRDVLRGYNVEMEGDYNRGLAIMAIFEELVEDKLIQPVHIIDHPKETTPLCKAHRKEKDLIERFESFCLGTEMCNAYSELNDPILQKKLLQEQASKLRAGFEQAHPMDEDFVNAIEIGMPPTGGLGFGIDRMAICLTGAETIRDVILFPTMKPEEKEEIKHREEKEK
jgi:lysyl-tRNA synthetase class 2